MSDIAVSLKSVWEVYEVKFIIEKKSHWEKIWALKGIDLDIKKGECICIIGENGSGKSTLLKLISGMLKPDKGQVLINGSVSALLELGAGFHPELTGRDNVYLNASLFGLSRREIGARMPEIIEFSGLGKFIDATVKCYSQGMFVRLAFSLAIHVNPDVLLIDDTLSVGDEDFQKKCIKKIFQLKDQGKTIIIVTHDLNMAEKLCSSGIILTGGKIMQTGPLKRIIPSYLETVGNRKGLAILQHEHLRIIFNNGCLFLNWKGIRLTKHLGGYISCFIKDRNFLSNEFHWNIEHIDGRKLVARGTHAYLSVEYIWTISMFEDFSFRIEIDRYDNSKEEDVQINDECFNLMLSEEYLQWTSVRNCGNFKTEFAHQVNWEATDEKKASGNILGVIPVEGEIEFLPGLVLDASQNYRSYNVTAHNSGANVQARVLRVPLTENASKLFESTFRIFSEFEQMQNFLRIKKEEHTLSAGGTKILADSGKVSIYYGEQELTQDIGLFSSFLIDNKWHDTSQASCFVEKELSCFKISFFWQGLELYQYWKISFLNPRIITWEIGIAADSNLTIQEKKAGIMLCPEYEKWVYNNQTGEMPEITGWQDIVLKDSSYGILGLCSKDDKNSPNIFFSFSASSEFLPQLQNSTRQINARLLQARKIAVEEETVGSNISPYFSGKIFLDKLPTEKDLSAEKTEVGMKIKKVVFVNLPWKQNGMWGVRAGSRWPHIKDLCEGEYLPYPFFMGYAASLLKKNGFETEIIDAIASEISVEEFFCSLHSKTPDLVIAETSTVTLSHDIELLKRVDDKIPIAVCGADININANSFLRENPFIDFVMVGEYEFTLLELIQKLNLNEELSSVKGILFKKDGNIIDTPRRPLCDLDQLPWPLREGLPIHKYFDTPGGIPTPCAQMWASRGCPYQCIFCAWPHIMYGGGSYRVRDVMDVVDEMEYLVTKMGFKSVYFDDDTFNIGKVRMLELSNEIKKRQKIGRLPNFPWAIMARADIMDEDILTELKSAGLFAVKYGVESADQTLLNNCNKKMDIKKATRMIRLTKAMGIKVHLTFTFGLPGETYSTVKKTQEFVMKMDPDSAQFSITTPLPGTKYFADLDKKGWLLSKDWSDYDGNYKSVLRTEHLSAQELEQIQNNACRLWDAHCKKRKIIGGPRFFVNRFFSYWKACGFAFAIKKTGKYILFRIKDLTERQKEKKGISIVTKKLEIRIFANHRRIALFYGKNQLTKDIGFTTSLKVLGNWYDSSNARWSVEKITPSYIKIFSRWNELPVSQEWSIEIVGPRRVNWEVKTKIEEELFVQEEKSGLMLNPYFNVWHAGDEKGDLPKITGWEEIAVSDPESKYIGVSEHHKPSSGIPSLFLDFSKVKEALCQIQNSSRSLGARLIQARRVWGEGGRFYVPGTYGSFSSSILLKLSDSSPDTENTAPDFEEDISGIIYKKRSSFRLIKDSLKKNGIIGTIRKVIKYLHPKRFKSHYSSLLGIYDGKTAYTGPDFVQIDPSNNCNNCCIGCWCHSELLGEQKMPADEKSKQLPAELIRKVVDELHKMGTREIYFAGGGEPFTHPDLMEIVKYVKDKGFACYINTNFTLPDTKMIKKLASNAVDHMTISVWAGDSNTYIKTHPSKSPEDFKKLRNSIMLLNRIKTLGKPYVKIYNVISSLNYDNLEKMVDFAVETGSESLEFTLIDTIPGKTDDLLPDEAQTKCIIEQCENLKYRLQTDLHGKVRIIGFGQFLRRIKSRHISEGEYDKETIDALPKCYVGWTFARILADGNVNSCLKSHRIPVGNIYQESFKDIWNGAKQRVFRKHALAFDKADSFFRLIGNNPDIEEAGCYKSCDDIIRNINMHKKLMSLSLIENLLLKANASFRKLIRDIAPSKKHAEKEEKAVETEWLKK